MDIWKWEVASEILSREPRMDHVTGKTISTRSRGVSSAWRGVDRGFHFLGFHNRRSHSLLPGVQFPDSDLFYRRQSASDVGRYTFIPPSNKVYPLFLALY